MGKKKNTKNTFQIVSLLNKKASPFFNLIFALVLTGATLPTSSYIASLWDRVSSLFMYSHFIYILDKFIIDWLLLVLWIFSIIVIWILYFKARKKHRIKYFYVNKLRYFIDANKLYEMDTHESYDSNGKKFSKKYIVRSARFGVIDDSKTIIVRAYKDANAFSKIMNDLDSGLSALFGLSVDNKEDSVSYCDYYFKKQRDTRIVVNSSGEIKKHNSVLLPLNNNLKWNILKQPHMLLAGVTGSGKTTFLNYLLIELLKMNASLYIVDPKRSDLSSLKHSFGEEHVASEVNAIAKITREVKELMTNRFVTYKENLQNFVYGNSYVDYGLNPVFLVFDELGAFRAGADKKVFSETMDNLTEIILKGREMGVFCILSTQQPNASNIPTELRDNLSVRIALGNMSSEAYRMVFGSIDGILPSVNSIGSGYIYLDGLGWCLPKRFEAPFLDYKNFDFISEIKKYTQA